MGAICGAGNAIPSGTPKFIPPVLSGVTKEKVQKNKQ
jgi:hypothetical protein